jgi:hypothetical protein
MTGGYAGAPVPVLNVMNLARPNRALLGLAHIAPA